MCKFAVLFAVQILLYIGVNSSPQSQRRLPNDRYGYSRQIENRNQDLHFVLSAANLPSRDGRRVGADSYVKVHFGILPKYGNQQAKYLGDLGHSETVRNESDPKWVKVFEIQYNKGTNQKLYIEVQQQYAIYPNEAIGDAIIDLDEYVEYGHQLTVPLKGTKDGSVTIQNTAPFSFTLALKNIPALDGFGGYSDPYVKCYFRYGKDGRDYKFHETSTKDNTNKAEWDKPIKFENFIRGTDQMIHFVVRDEDSTSGDDDIGEAFLEVDAYVDKKQTSVLRIDPSSNATLLVKYVPDN